MKIHFIRHGQPDYSNINLEDNIETPNFAPLTEKGKEQAKNVNVDKLKNAKLILVSPYKRAFETATIINEKLKYQKKID